MIRVRLGKFGRRQEYHDLRLRIATTLWPPKFLFEIRNGRGNNGPLLLPPLWILSSPRLAVIYALRGTNSRWKDARTRCRHVHGNAHDRTLSPPAIFLNLRILFASCIPSLFHLFFNPSTFISYFFLHSNWDSSRAFSRRSFCST